MAMNFTAFITLLVTAAPSDSRLTVVSGYGAWAQQKTHGFSSDIAQGGPRSGSGLTRRGLISECGTWKGVVNSLPVLSLVFDEFGIASLFATVMLLNLLISNGMTSW